MAILANLVQHVRGSRIRASELKSANRVQIVCILFLHIFTIHESYAYLLVYTILLRIERNNFLRKNSLEIWNIKYCGILFDLNLRFETICIGCAKGKFGKHHSGIPRFWNGGDSKKKIPTELNPNVEVQDYFFSISSYSTRHEDQTPRGNHESHSLVLFEKIIKVLSLIPHMYACMYIHCVPKIVVEVERRSFTMQR